MTRYSDKVQRELLQNPNFEEWKQSGLCPGCGVKVGIFVKLCNRGVCSSCDKIISQKLTEIAIANQRILEEKLKQEEYERKKVKLPSDLREKGLESFIEGLISEKTERTAFAFWKNEESNVEKIGGHIAVALLTGGFGKASQTIQFGIITVAKDKLWRIEMGDVFLGLSFYPKDMVLKMIKSIELREVQSILETDEPHSALILNSTTTDPLIPSDSMSTANIHELRLIFPHIVDMSEEPFYEYFPNNQKEGEEIGRIAVGLSKF